MKKVHDNEIIKLLQERDETALAVIKQQYGALCRQIAMQVLDCDEDADECLNDALLNLWCSIPPAKPDYLRAYLSAAVRNIALDRLASNQAVKRGGSQVPLVLEELSEIAAEGQDVASEVELRQLWDAIHAFLKRENVRNQKLFMQRYYYMMPLKEIAAENGLSENSVTVTLHRLRNKLMEHLRKEHFL